MSNQPKIQVKVHMNRELYVFTIKITEIEVVVWNVMQLSESKLYTREIGKRQRKEKIDEARCG